MLTRRGWGLAAGSLALATLGRVLGVYELFVLAAGGAGLLAVAAGSVLGRRVALGASRRLRPARLHAGSDSRVELAVHNRGRRASPVVTIRDFLAPLAPTGGGGGLTARRGAGAPTLREEAGVGAPAGAAKPPTIRFLLAPVGAGRAETATYRLHAERRGIYRLGPLVAQRADPLGLWSVVTEVAPAVSQTVYPATDPVVPLSRRGGDDPTAGGPRPAGVGPHGDDFYGLRPYQRGDDLRRVHWASTARADELMVRQVEMPWEGRATVLLDVRPAVHTPSSLEATVSAAASILVASRRTGSQVRLVTTNGTDSGFTTGQAHFEAAMEHLAVIEPRPPEGSGDDAFEAVASGLRRAGNGGALAVVTTAAAAADLEKAAGLRARFDSVVVVLLNVGGRAPDGPATGVAGAAGMTIVAVGPGRSFATAWNAALGATLPAGAASPWS